MYSLYQERDLNRSFYLDLALDKANTCETSGYLRILTTNEYFDDLAINEFLLIYTKNLSMSGRPARRPWSRFWEAYISGIVSPIDKRSSLVGSPIPSAVRSSFILRITYPQSSVTPPLAGPSGRRPPGMWRSPEPSPGSGGPPGLRATHAAWRRWWQPHKARLDHPGDVHFGLLKPISFIPWLWNGQVWPKGPYPNQTKKKTFCRAWDQCRIMAVHIVARGACYLRGCHKYSACCISVTAGRLRWNLACTWRPIS